MLIPICLPGVRGQMTQWIALLQFAGSGPFATSSLEQQDLFVVESIDLFVKTHFLLVSFLSLDDVLGKTVLTNCDATVRTHDVGIIVSNDYCNFSI